MKIRLTRRKNHVLVQIIHSKTVVATYRAVKVLVDGHVFWLQEGQVELEAAHARYRPRERLMEIRTAAGK